GAGRGLLVWSGDFPYGSAQQEDSMNAHDPRHLDHVDRRTFLKRVGAAGAGAAIASRLPSPGTAVAQDATVKPDPAAKRGGDRPYGVPNAPPPLPLPHAGARATHRPPDP